VRALGTKGLLSSRVAATSQFQQIRILVQQARIAYLKLYFGFDVNADADHMKTARVYTMRLDLKPMARSLNASLDSNRQSRHPSPEALGGV